MWALNSWRLRKEPAGAEREKEERNRCCRGLVVPPPGVADWFADPAVIKFLRTDNICNIRRVYDDTTHKTHFNSQLLKILKIQNEKQPEYHTAVYVPRVVSTCFSRSKVPSSPTSCGGGVSSPPFAQNAPWGQNVLKVICRYALFFQPSLANSRSRDAVSTVVLPSGCRPPHLLAGNGQGFL